MCHRNSSERKLTVPLFELRSSTPSNPLLLSTANINQSHGLNIRGRDVCSYVLFEVSRCDLFTSPCSKICHHLICMLLIIKGQILHPMDICLHLPRPLCLDGSLSPRMNVTGSALNEILDAGLKAYRDAGMIRNTLDDVQTILQTLQRHRTLFVDKTCCCRLRW